MIGIRFRCIPHSDVETLAKTSYTFGSILSFCTGLKQFLFCEQKVKLLVFKTFFSVIFLHEGCLIIKQGSELGFEIEIGLETRFELELELRFELGRQIRFKLELELGFELGLEIRLS